MNFPDCPQYFFNTVRRAPVAPASCRRFSICAGAIQTRRQDAGATVRSQSSRIAASNYTEYPGPVGGAGSGPGIGSGSGSAGGKFGSPVPGVSGVGGVVTGSSGRGSGLPGCSGPGCRAASASSNSPTLISLCKVNDVPRKFTQSVKVPGLRQQSGKYLRPTQEIERLTRIVALPADRLAQHGAPESSTRPRPSQAIPPSPQPPSSDRAPTRPKAGS